MKPETERNLVLFSKALFVLYLFVMSYFLFFSERYGRTEGSDGYRYNLVLFQEIRRFLFYRHSLGFESVAVNLIGNIVAFAPFGFCLPILSKRAKGFFRVVAFSFLFSLTIETIQLFYRIGIFDVDDLFLNTIGGGFGYLMHLVVARIGRSLRKS